MKTARRWLTPRRVDVLLGVALVATVATGLGSWAVGTGWARVVTVTHGVVGLSLLALAPAKIRGSVRAGIRRRRVSRWFSLLLGVLVVATITLGLLHATGLWYGVGYWSPLWTHFLLAALLAPLALWHILSRRGRRRIVDLDRRAAAGGAAALLTAGAAYGVQQLVVGNNRRFTGSHEVASFDPRHMPRVSWLNDQTPRVAAAAWDLSVDGTAVTIPYLQQHARPLEAVIDCTGGWWSRQSWDAVPLSDVFEELHGGLNSPTLEVTSLTGYSRLFPATDAHNLFLAVGYGGQPLRYGHGAPVRLVAPGRRGFWWVKWVTGVDSISRPWWLQLPFPLE